MALALWPWLGGDRAQASYLICNPWEPSLLLPTDGGREARTAPPAAEGQEKNNAAHRNSVPAVPHADAVPQPYCQWALGLGQSGGSCGTTSGTASAGVSVLPAALNHPPDLVSHQEVCRLYFENAQCQPSPFPSRLFRPPPV